MTTYNTEFYVHGKQITPEDGRGLRPKHVEL